MLGEPIMPRRDWLRTVSFGRNGRCSTRDPLCNTFGYRNMSRCDRNSGFRSRFRACRSNDPRSNSRPYRSSHGRSVFHCVGTDHDGHRGRGPGRAPADPRQMQPVPTPRKLTRRHSRYYSQA